jgi:hypothetical protein
MNLNECVQIYMIVNNVYEHIWMYMYVYESEWM